MNNQFKADKGKGKGKVKGRPTRATDVDNQDTMLCAQLQSVRLQRSRQHHVQ